MSEAGAIVVRIGAVEKHPNADTLSITNVHGGYPCVFRTGDFKEGDLAVYVPVDSMVPLASPEFKFLDRGKGKTHHRVTAVRLRGVFSMGLLVPATDEMAEGEDVTVDLGIEKYESPSEQMERVGQHNVERSAKKVETARYDTYVRTIVGLVGGAVMVAASSYSLHWYTLVSVCVAAGLIAQFFIARNRKLSKKPNIPVYDIEGFRKHSNVFKEGEHVWITEKIHGMNASFVHTGKKFHAKSRTMFRNKVDSCRWWKIAEKYGLEEKLKNHPNVVLFGEIYGSGVQDLEYGCAQGEIRFAAFDAMDIKTRKYLDPFAFWLWCLDLGIPTVPTLYDGPYHRELVEGYAEGPSTIDGANHVREGVVIKPEFERQEHSLGRCFLKLAGQGYLTRKDAA